MAVVNCCTEHGEFLCREAGTFHNKAVGVVGRARLQMNNLSGLVDLLIAGEPDTVRRTTTNCLAATPCACQPLQAGMPLPVHVHRAASQAHPLPCCVLQEPVVSLVPAPHLGACHIPFQLGGRTPQFPVGKLAYMAMTTVLQARQPATALNLLWGPRETSGKMGGYLSLGPDPSAQEELTISSQALATLAPGARLAVEVLQRFALVANDMLRGHGVAILQAVDIRSAATLEAYRAGSCIVRPQRVTDLLPAQFVQQEGQEGAQQQLRAVSADLLCLLWCCTCFSAASEMLHG